MSEITVVKRSGNREKFNIKKVRRVVEWAVEGVEDVSVDEIINHFEFNFTSDGITTKQIHSGLIEACVNLITEDAPDYQWPAGKLLVYQLRKDVWGGKNPPRLIDLVRQNIEKGYYDKSILQNYSVKEINKINEFVDHDRDLKFPHGGIQQLISKYLVQNRKTKEIAETPQFAYVLVAMTLFANEKKEFRLERVKKAYDLFSDFTCNLSTPVIGGARTPLRSYASCALFDIEDSMKSIGCHDYLLKAASAARYGLGFNISRLRPLNAPIRHGDVLSSGLVPYLKNFESGIKACHQNGLRGASGTVFINFWHSQVEDVLVLNDNATPDERAVRKLDFCLCGSRLFEERFKNSENITLFNPHETPELLERFGMLDWDDLYKIREQDESISRKVIGSRELMKIYAQQRLATGRIYYLNVDNINDSSPFLEPVQQSNLCQEILQPVRASQQWNDPNALIGVCLLSAVNAMNVDDEAKFESACETMVQMLDLMIDSQEYFDLAAANFAKKYRSLGIGAFNFAGYMADNKMFYTNPKAPDFAARFAEKLSFYCIKASIALAKEKGKFEYFDKTKWSQGLLPVDRYNKAVDEFVGEPQMPWDSLREDLAKYGIRNSTLTAYMPVESSSVISGGTSGLEPIRSYIVDKTSKATTVKNIAPKLKKNKHYYSLAFEMRSNEGLLKIYAAINKWTCMGISANTYINAADYPHKQIPLSVIVSDTLKFSEYGGKTLYYQNTDDGANSSYEEKETCSVGGCAL